MANNKNKLKEGQSSETIWSHWHPHQTIGKTGYTISHQHKNTQNWTMDVQN